MELSESDLVELVARLDAELPTVQEAVNRVMRDVQAIGKGQEYDDKRGTKYSFRGVDDVVNAVGPALREHKVIIAPVVVDVVNSERYDTKGGARMQNVVVKVSYRVSGPRGDKFPAESLGQAADMGDKGIPKAMSVAYRTMLLQLLSIPTGEPDPDSQVHEAAASNGRPVTVAPDRTEWDAANAAIAEWQARLGWTNQQVWEAYVSWNEGRTLDRADAVARQDFVQQLAAHHLQRQAPTPGQAAEERDRWQHDAEHDAMTETQSAALTENMRASVAESDRKAANDEPPF
jgi:hypothetical protein